MASQNINSKQQLIIEEIDLDSLTKAAEEIQFSKTGFKVFKFEKDVERRFAFIEQIDFDSISRTAMALESGLIPPVQKPAQLFQQFTALGSDLRFQKLHEMALQNSAKPDSAGKKQSGVENTPNLIIARKAESAIQGELGLKVQKQQKKKMLSKSDYDEIDRKISSLSDSELLAIAMEHDIELYSRLGEGKLEADEFRQRARKIAKELELSKKQETPDN